MPETRPLKVIKKELSELNQLIIENKEILATYPDDISLKIGLRNLLYRQRQIFSEIKEAKQLRTQETFDMVLEEGGIPDTEVSFAFFGNYLTATQDLVTALINKTERGEISKGPISNEIKDRSRLNLVATAVGSFRIIITGNPGISEPPVVSALTTFNSLLECGDNREKIKNIRSFVGARVMKKYKNFIHIMKIYKANVTFYDAFGEAFFTPHILTKELVDNIYTILEEVKEMPETIETYNGKLRGSDVVDKSFHFETIDGVQFKGKYDDNIESLMVRPDFEKNVIVTVKHNITYLENDDREVDKWELIGIKIDK